MDPMEDDFPFQLGDFWVQNVNCQGCSYMIGKIEFRLLFCLVPNGRVSILHMEYIEVINELVTWRILG